MARKHNRLVNFMATPADHAAWAAYAKEHRMTLGAFLREAANAAMVDGRPDVPPSKPNFKVEPERPPRKPLDEVLEEIAKEAPKVVAALPASPKVSDEPCDNRLPSGAFCVRCYKIHQ